MTKRHAIRISTETMATLVAIRKQAKRRDKPVPSLCLLASYAVKVATKELIGKYVGE